MAEHELADFVRNGTFTWTRHGYHFTELPQVDLLTPEALRSEDPWVQVAAALEHAKMGDHSHISGLRKWFQVRSATALDRVCMLVTADAGSEEDLEGLVGVMQDGDDKARMYACLAAADAGSLWLVPHMLNAWRRAATLGDHESIGFAIADLLEERNSLEDMGPIAENAGRFELELDKFPPPANADKRALGEKLAIQTKGRNEIFERLVNDRLDEVRLRVGGDRVPVWGSARFGVVSFARQFYSLIRNQGAKTWTWGTAIAMRRKFESATGLECSSFFKKDRFQPLAAAAVLEGFLDRTPPEAYTDGVRYFFGHPIPGATGAARLR